MEGGFYGVPCHPEEPFGSAQGRLRDEGSLSGRSLTSKGSLAEFTPSRKVSLKWRKGSLASLGMTGQARGSG
jgi:hypothetical protein